MALAGANCFEVAARDAMGNSSETRATDRREALKKIALGTGGIVTLPILGQVALTPAMARSVHWHPGWESAPSEAEWKPLFLDAHQNETVTVLTELIIPATNTPGAKAALVNRFIDLLLSEEDAERRKKFVEGLSWVEARSLKLYSKTFIGLTPEQQSSLLTPLADHGNKNPEDRTGVEFFDQLKDLTIFGYYTSKVGMEQELEYGGGDYHTEFPGACTHPEHQT